MGLLESNTALMLQRSMNFLWTKQSCILDNIANAETPNYKTKYATFEESLDNAIRQAAGESRARTLHFVRPSRIPIWKFTRPRKVRGWMTTASISQNRQWNWPATAISCNM